MSSSSSSRALACLGRFARQAMQTTEQGASANQLTTKRFYYPERYSPRQFDREKPVDASALWWHKSAFVEAWVWRRDNLEREFSWNTRNTFELTYFIGGMTALFYALSIFGLRSADRQSGYPKRSVMFHDATNFTNPDERDFY